MNFTTTKTDKGNFVTNEVKAKATVSENEVKSRIAAVKNSLDSSKFDPKKLTEQYNDIVQGRGYTSFDSKGREAWHNEFGHMGHADIRKVANMRADAFMKTVNDPNQADHAKARELFKNSFELDENKVRDHFINETNVEYGRTFRGGPSCNQDVSYEGKMCSTGAVSTQTAQAEKDTLNALMRARFDAQGYREGTGTDDDKEFVDRFFSDYAIALQPGGPKIVK